MDLKRVDPSRRSRWRDASRASADAEDAIIDRRASVRRHEPAEGSGVLLSRDHRGDHQHADESSRVARHLPHVGVCVSGQDLDVTEIGRRLRVGTALEGSVRKAGDRVRVTAQLVNAEDGYQLWSKRFDRELVGRLCDPGRDRRDHRQRASEAAPAPGFAEAAAGKPPPGRSCSAQVGRLRASPRRVPEGDVRAEQWTEHFDAAGHRRLPRPRSLGIPALPRRTPPSRRVKSGSTRAWASFRPARRCRRLDGPSTRPWSSTRPWPTRTRFARLIAMNHDWDRTGAERMRSRARSSSVPARPRPTSRNAWRLAASREAA